MILDTMFKNGPSKKGYATKVFFYFWSVYFLTSNLLFKKIFVWNVKGKDEINMKESENSLYPRF